MFNKIKEWFNVAYKHVMYYFTGNVDYLYNTIENEKYIYANSKLDQIIVIPLINSMYLIQLSDCPKDIIITSSHGTSDYIMDNKYEFINFL